ncbi:hypothetical protein [Streptomyces litchfieldiae]|uniref:Uncharacterized protein n=1 Tax=Streptomyces litchfieldiae TaxID=3075543 RepID=A0ABU2N498_9ACTN|nr:hypothetical protein [Streptomyces sp. DSM 44938]MDT0347559.1 hypothetical protein [Streptomyces sp. DSM 44938]
MASDAGNIEKTSGVLLLLDIGRERPEFAVWGQTLVDQGRIITGMRDAGWTRAQIMQIVTGQPLPKEIHTSVGAIIAGRLKAAAKVGPPGGWRPFIPPQDLGLTGVPPVVEPEAPPQAPATELPHLTESETDPCPGWDGAPCGRAIDAVADHGLCGQCAISAHLHRPERLVAGAATRRGSKS